MKKPLQHFLFLCFCFTIDTLSFIHFQYPLLHATFCFSLTTFLYYRCSFLYLLSLFLLGLQTFLGIDLFGFNFLYLAPLFGIIHLTRKFIPNTSFVALISLLFYLISNHILLSCFGLKIPFWGWYTFWEFGVNLVVLFISLKWLSTVERGNRFELL